MCIQRRYRGRYDANTRRLRARAREGRGRCEAEPPPVSSFFRRYSAMMFARFREGIRLAHEREKRRKAIVEAGAWWSKRTKEADKLLPTNKRFGRYRPIQTSEGWGVWEGGANRGTKPYWAAAKSAPGAQVSAARGARARGAAADES